MDLNVSNCSGISTACRGCFTGPPSCQADVATTTQQPETELGQCDRKRLYL